MYAWGDDKRWNSYSNHLSQVYGEKVQKISVDGGFTCPNRDGKISTKGCTFCDNRAFTPCYCDAEKSITQQIQEGIAFHERRGRKAGKYVVYFQSFSNTYSSVEHLRELYQEALSFPHVVGLVIGTRPDCVDEERLDFLAKVAERTHLTVEYGIESTSDATLRRVNRGHTFAQARWAVEETAKRGIEVGAHFILGLPFETDQMLIDQCEVINSLPLTSVKFHQLQILRSTPMAKEWDEHPEDFDLRDEERYLNLAVEILRRLRPTLVVERFVSKTPPRFHHHEGWKSSPRENFMQLLAERLAERDVYQGEFLLTLYNRIL